MAASFHTFAENGVGGREDLSETSSSTKAMHEKDIWDVVKSLKEEIVELRKIIEENFRKSNPRNGGFPAVFYSEANIRSAESCLLPVSSAALAKTPNGSRDNLVYSATNWRYQPGNVFTSTVETLAAPAEEFAENVFIPDESVSEESSSTKDSELQRSFRSSSVFIRLPVPGFQPSFHECILDELGFTICVRTYLKGRFYGQRVCADVLVRDTCVAWFERLLRDKYLLVSVVDRIGRVEHNWKTFRSSQKVYLESSTKVVQFGKTFYRTNINISAPTKCFERRKYKKAFDEDMEVMFQLVQRSLYNYNICKKLTIITQPVRKLPNKSTVF